MITSGCEFSITKDECSVLLNELNTTPIYPLRSALCATFWNLSVVEQNRQIMKDEGVILALTKQLKSRDVGTLREASGALRNLALDVHTHECFAHSHIIHSIAGMLSLPRLDSIVADHVLCCLSKISVHKRVRKYLLKSEMIGSIIYFLDDSTLDDTLVAFSLITLYHISLELKSGALKTLFTKELVEILLKRDNFEVKEIIRAIQHNIDETVTSYTTSTTQNSTGQRQRRMNSNSEDGSEFIDSEEVRLHTAEAKEVLQMLNLEQTIRWQDIILQTKIGEGGFGDVWKGTYHSCPVAVKVVKREMSSADALTALDEISLMGKLKHPNVVLLMGACLNDINQIMIITEFATRGDLRGVLMSHDLRSLPLRLKIGLDIASGLQWLASHGIVHRDLKLPNLLVFEDWTTKVADFGLSLQLREGHVVSRFGGNVKYSAPEILDVRYQSKLSGRPEVYEYSEKTDIYSYGLILWEIVSLKALFVRPREYAGKKGLTRYVLEGHRPPIEKAWSDSLKQLLRRCWHADPVQRPTFEEIVSMWPDLTTHVLCPDPCGREIVDKLWGREGDSNVAFDEFRKVFEDVCFKDDITVIYKKNHRSIRKMMSLLLCETQFEDVVSKKRFCSVVSWFGPLDKQNNCRGFFARIQDLLSMKFFHGFLGSKKAQSHMMKLFDTRKLQTYCVRFSEVEVGGFYLSFTEDDGRVTNESITNKGGKLFVENLMEEYDSWKKLISTCKSVWGLKKVLPNSPYEADRKHGFS
eukprot:TRINITY_DN6391_c0_g1_i3.p1 TRINITY_DN6391_c0_g1~~TRINITY_DN6391_c0_g1_i3.p1  ORF type:complete len:828 (+),score=128.23 TRINITY_DN6391_c0_g1_i3:229-2484(+)